MLQQERALTPISVTIKLLYDPSVAETVPRKHCTCPGSGPLSNMRLWDRYLTETYDTRVMSGSITQEEMQKLFTKVVKGLKALSHQTLCLSQL